ncbi:MAG: phosphatidate cytidylyltransferase [Desulfococcaceae bacterium]
MERSHLHRWITGLILFPLLIYLVFRGGIAFAGFAAGIAFLAMLEYVHIALTDENGRWLDAFSILGMITPPVMVWASHVHSPEFVLLILFFNLMGCAGAVLAKFSTQPYIVDKTGRQLQGLLLIGVPLSAAVLIRDGSDGAAWLLLVLTVVFAGDIGAFYAGTRLGRHKLLPGVSPGKTVEGAIGGLAANLLVGSVVKIIFLPSLNWHESLPFFLLLGAAGQVGDLFESAFKRAAGVKDSGRLLPGHGGVLDRVDALLFALPVAYFFKKFILWV